jgi:hypothetical protein
MLLFTEVEKKWDFLNNLFYTFILIVFSLESFFPCIRKPRKGNRNDSKFLLLEDYSCA